MFQSCQRIKNHKFSFDFYLTQYNTCIEYDGISHFIANPYGGWRTEQSVKDQQIKDMIKNEWCKNNNIHLIRIPYTYLLNIELKDLLPQTTSFLIC